MTDSAGSVRWKRAAALGKLCARLRAVIWQTEDLAERKASGSKWRFESASNQLRFLQLLSAEWGRIVPKLLSFVEVVGRTHPGRPRRTLSRLLPTPQDSAWSPLPLRSPLCFCSAPDAAQRPANPASAPLPATLTPCPPHPAAVKTDRAHSSAASSTTSSRSSTSSTPAPAVRARARARPRCASHCLLLAQQPHARLHLDVPALRSRPRPPSLPRRDAARLPARPHVFARDRAFPPAPLPAIRAFLAARKR